MNGHLSSEQISEWTLGLAGPEVREHVESCSKCRADAMGLSEALTHFRGSVREWSDQQLRSEPARARFLVSRPGAGRLAWALAAVAVCILMISLMLFPRQSRPQPTESAAMDALLLKQVDAEVSSAVPSSMEPLTRLVSWDSNSGGN